MFTGLVEAVGRVESASSDEAGVGLVVRAPFSAEVQDGDSVAVNGVCLTVTRHDETVLAFDVMHESLRRSTLGDLDLGAPVNLERAMRADARLGGHIVSGHVDGVGELMAVSEDGFARRLRIRAAADLLRHVVEKGSITVEGVSLTVAATDAESFEVSLIPETLSRTTLGEIAASGPGTPVNLETDVLAKHVEKLVDATLHEQVGAAIAAHLAENGIQR